MAKHVLLFVTLLTGSTVFAQELVTPKIDLFDGEQVACVVHQPAAKVVPLNFTLKYDGAVTPGVISASDTQIAELKRQTIHVFVDHQIVHGQPAGFYEVELAAADVRKDEIATAQGMNTDAAPTPNGTTFSATLADLNLSISCHVAPR